MTTADRPALVRPRFLKWSAVVFVLLVPFVIHAAWDYAETRRLAASIAKIRDRHEPVTSWEIHPYRVPADEAADADRYYRAAAVLADVETDEARRPTIRARVSDAVDLDTWPDDLVADLRNRVSRGADALRLLDRATPLPFEGFGPGTNYSIRTGEMRMLADLASLRTRLLTIDGDGTRAIESFYAELRLQRTLDEAPNASITPRFSGFGATLAMIVTRTRPDAASLTPIASRLRELDRDDWLKRDLLLQRTALLDSTLIRGSPVLTTGSVRQPGFWDSIRWPWFMQLLTQRLETLAALIDGANRPWPARLDAPASAYLSHTAAESRFPRFREGDELRSANIASDLALIRCARLVLAVERYRLEHGQARPSRIDDLVPSYLDTIPVDPFSGTPLRFASREGGYVVYSVGRNRRDDGGRFTTKELLARRSPGAPAPATDVGIRISYR